MIVFIILHNKYKSQEKNKNTLVVKQTKVFFGMLKDTNLKFIKTFDKLVL